MLFLASGVQTDIQAGLVPRGRIGVQHALLNRFIERRNGLPERRFGCLFVAFGKRFAQIAENGAQAGRVGAIANGSLFSLTGAFQCRKMVCHVIRLPLFLGFSKLKQGMWIGTSSYSTGLSYCWSNGYAANQSSRQRHLDL